MVTIKKNISTGILSLLLVCASCSTESRFDEPTTPDTPDKQTERREVMLTLNNKLSVQPATAPRAAIATAEENAISTLDIYVFGAAEENGTYTYQQRFAYRSDEAAAAPGAANLQSAAAQAAGIEELQLSEAMDGDGSVTTGLLSLKRGLFVKLYCVANDTVLINPADGAAMKIKDYIPIKFNAAGSNTPIQTVGVPMEKDFLKYRTTLLTAGKAADTKDEVLLTPLSMSGAMTTPLDLTDPTNTSRLQARLRLTRLAARFDIVNDAVTSHFTIRSISMANARKGASFFPIAVHGDTPAKADELITMASRTFSSAPGAGTGAADAPNANQGLSTGAFYSYPSPTADKGYLILKGLYQVNQTEQKEVTYQVPFTQDNGSGAQTWLEINNNHRYTIAISKADDYRLDFTLNVADWEDDGSIDEYIPENKPGEITVNIPDGFKGDTQDNYDNVRNIHTVSMSLKDGSAFDAHIGTTSPLTLTKTYAGGPDNQQYDWLEITEPIIARIAATTYTYTFAVKKPYILGRYPRATIRIFDALSGDETILYVEAIAVPQPAESTQPSKAPNGTSANPNTFDVQTQTATLYRITGSEATVRLTCPDGAVLKTKPDWTDVTEESRNGADIIYKVTLNDRDTNEAAGTVTFGNEKHPELVTDINLNLADASIKPSFAGIGTDNTYTPPATDDLLGNIDVKITDGNQGNISTTSMDGVTVKADFDGGPEWFTHDGVAATTAVTTATTSATTTAAATADLKAASADLKAAASPRASISPRAGTQQNAITFKLVNSKLAGAKTATVTLVNKIGGKNFQFTITPKLELGTMEKVSSLPVNDKIEEGKKLTLYKLPAGKTSTMTVKITSYGGSTLESADDAVLKVEKTTPAKSAPQAAKSAPRAADTETQEANEAYYLLTAIAPGTTTLKRSNLTDPAKNETFAVTVLSSEITVPDPATIAFATTAVNQTATARVSSPLGFTASVTDFADGGNGGQAWMTVTTTDVPSGSNDLIAKVTAVPATLRPTTVTLKNKIVDGGDKTIVVHPTYAVPAFTRTAATPSQNTQPDANTIQLYNVPNTSLTLDATAMGGSTLTNLNNVKVATNNAAGSYGTKYTYTIQAVDQNNNGSFVIENKSDATKKLTVNVTALSADITASNVSVTAANSGATNFTVSSPAGCKASVVNGWGTNGGQWFDITNANVAAGSNKTFTITQRNNTNTVMKPVTIRLTNTIVGGPDKDITLTPNFEAPTISKTEVIVAKTNNVSGSQSNNFTFTIPAGGYEVVNSSTTNAGHSISNTTVTVTYKKNGTASLTVRNKSDNTKTAVCNVKSIDYNGNAVWYYGGVYVAPTDVAVRQRWNSNWTTNNQGPCPNGWHIPTKEEWEKVYNTGEYYQEMKDNKLFDPLADGHLSNGVNDFSYYWSSTRAGSNAYGWKLWFDKNGMGVDNAYITSESELIIRCVAN